MLSKRSCVFSLWKLTPSRQAANVLMTCSTSHKNQEVNHPARSHDTSLQAAQQDVLRVSREAQNNRFDLWTTGRGYRDRPAGGAPLYLHDPKPRDANWAFGNTPSRSH